MNFMKVSLSPLSILQISFLDDQSEVECSIQPALQVERWYHVAFVHKGHKQYEASVNGLFAEMSCTRENTFHHLPAIAHGTKTVAHFGGSAFSHTERFKGMIYDFRFYNSPLSISQLGQLLQHESDVQPVIHDLMECNAEAVTGNPLKQASNIGDGHLSVMLSVLDVDLSASHVAMPNSQRFHASLKSLTCVR